MFVVSDMSVTLLGKTRDDLEMRALLFARGDGAARNLHALGREALLEPALLETRVGVTVLRGDFHVLVFGQRHDQQLAMLAQHAHRFFDGTLRSGHVGEHVEHQDLIE